MNDHDAQLVEQALLGDEQAFYAMVSAVKKRLFHIAMAYLKNDEDALEAVQAATCRAWIHRKKIKEPPYFMTWLIRILINYCIDEQKRNRRFLQLTHEPVAAGVIEYDDRKIDLETALDALKPKYRHVIILKYYDDMTFAEIANVLGRPESTIKTWLYKGLKQLREQLNKGGEGDHV